MIIIFNWNIIKTIKLKHPITKWRLTSIFITKPLCSISKRSHESLYGLHETLLRHHREVQKQRFTTNLTSCPGSGQERLLIQNKMLKQRKTVQILKTAKFTFRENLDFCCKKSVKIIKIWNQHIICNFYYKLHCC